MNFDSNAVGVSFGTFASLGSVSISLMSALDLRIAPPVRSSAGTFASLGSPLGRKVRTGLRPVPGTVKVVISHDPTPTTHTR